MQRAEARKNPVGFDTIGLGLLVIVMASWEVVLSKGQEWDWFGDPFYRVQTLSALFVVGLVALVVWELRRPNPLVDFRPLADRNFAVGSIIIACAFAVLYGQTVSLPGDAPDPVRVRRHALRAGAVAGGQLPRSLFCRSWPSSSAGGSTPAGS